MRMSKSKVLTFQQCPRKFKYDYIDGLSYDRDEPLPGTPLKIGLDVHEIFEWYYKQEEAALISRPYYISIIDILMEHPLVIPEYYKFLENFAKFNVRLIEEKGIPGYLPVGVELKLHDENLDLNGIMDVVYEGEDGKIIMDYKTGRPKPIGDYLLELTLYKILYENVTGEKVSHCGIYFPKNDSIRMAKVLRPGQDPPEKMPLITLEDEFMALDVLDYVNHQIEKKNFPAKPGFLCRYCDYENMCMDEGLRNL